MPVFRNLKDETIRAVGGVFYALLGVVFIFAAFHNGGVAGEFIAKYLFLLFGIGFYFLPLIFFFLSVSSFRGEERSVTRTQWLGVILLLLTSLGLVNIALGEKGGLVGEWVSEPLLSIFDVYVTTIALVGLLVVACFVMFDSAFNIHQLFGKKKEEGEDDESEEEEAEVPVTVGGKKVEEDAPEEKQIDEPKIAPKEEKKKGLFGGGFMAQPPRRAFAAKEFVPPPLSLLERDKGKPVVGDIKANANIIKRTLENFGIAVEMDEVSIGPSVTRYALKPAEGVKLAKIVGLQSNLELALAAHPVRIEAPIPGKSLVGIEVPNTAKTTIGLGTLLDEEEFGTSDKPLLVSLGKDIAGRSHFTNVAKAPHMLIAGATGSGKSVTIHAVVTSLLFRNPPENLKFIMIDPKRVELTLYNKIPHLLTPVITDAKKAILALKWAAKEMDRRYDVLQEHQVRDIVSYHKTILEPSLKKGSGGEADEGGGLEAMPYIVIIIDELADIMQAYPRELESAIVRLAQMSRAVGIHLILSTQRPSVNVITGLIKANVPSRIALQVASQFDSRTILDMAGAEKLLGAGDMLFMSGEMSKPVRIQSAFISEGEVKKVVKYLAENYEDELPQIDVTAIKDQNSEAGGSGAIFAASMDDDEGDELYEEARETVIAAQKASTSFLQRKLGIGYARAARLMDILEERGVIGPGSGAKPRDVLVKPGGELEQAANELLNAAAGADEEETETDEGDTEEEQ